MVLRSVKNWLTILILALVALAMIVAWAYVVPPLANRLDQQKLVDQRGNAKLISDTVIGFLNDPSARGSLETTISLLGQRLTARVVVITKSMAAVYDTQGTTDPIATDDYPMIKRALTSARVVQGVVVTQVGRYAATAVPIPPVGTVQYVVLVIAPLRDVDNAVEAVQHQLLRATLFALLISLALGYLTGASANDASGNFAILDNIQALKYIQQNIAPIRCATRSASWRRPLTSWPTDSGAPSPRWSTNAIASRCCSTTSVKASSACRPKAW